MSAKNILSEELISTAPELLEVLKLIYDSTAVLNHLDLETQHLICEVIAKAEGRTK